MSGNNKHIWEHDAGSNGSDMDDDEFLMCRKFESWLFAVLWSVVISVGQYHIWYPILSLLPWIGMPIFLFIMVMSVVIVGRYIWWGSYLMPKFGESPEISRGWSNVKGWVGDRFTDIGRRLKK